MTDHDTPAHLICSAQARADIDADMRGPMRRTFGQSRHCEGCRFWSQMVAQSIGCGPTEALCLSGDGPKAGKMTTDRDTCAAWKSGHFGATDDPPNYGEHARAAYEREAKLCDCGAANTGVLHQAGCPYVQHAR